MLKLLNVKVFGKCLYESKKEYFSHNHGFWAKFQAKLIFNLEFLHLSNSVLYDEVFYSIISSSEVEFEFIKRLNLVA